MDDEGIDIIVDSFVWSNEYKDKNIQISKIHETIIQILC